MNQTVTEMMFLSYGEMMTIVLIHHGKSEWLLSIGETEAGLFLLLQLAMHQFILSFPIPVLYKLRFCSRSSGVVQRD